jgi:hypothetical protein
MGLLHQFAKANPQNRYLNVLDSMVTPESGDASAYMGPIGGMAKIVRFPGSDNYFSRGLMDDMSDVDHIVGRPIDTTEQREGLFKSFLNKLAGDLETAENSNLVDVGHIDRLNTKAWLANSEPDTIKELLLRHGDDSQPMNELVNRMNDVRKRKESDEIAQTNRSDWFNKEENHTRRNKYMTLLDR